MALLLVLAGLGGLGLLWYRHQESSKEVTAEAGQASEFVVPEPVAAPPVIDEGPKPLPARLIGTWELRADDGRTGRLSLNADGTLVAASVQGNSPIPDYYGHWYMFEEAGDRYVLEFGREHGAPDSYKVTVLLTDPDAFTLIESLKAGMPTGEKHRFVRAEPAGANSPKSP